MRSDRSRRITRGDGACELGIGSDQVERVGIEYQGHVLRQRAREQAVRRVVRAYARAGDERVGTGIENVVRALQHELGLYPVDWRPLARRESDPNFSSGYALERVVELQTLCDPAIRRALAAHSIQLVSYHDLGQLQAAVAA